MKNGAKGAKVPERCQGGGQKGQILPLFEVFSLYSLYGATKLISGQDLTLLTPPSFTTFSLSVISLYSPSEKKRSNNLSYILHSSREEVQSRRERHVNGSANGSANPPLISITISCVNATET